MATLRLRDNFAGEQLGNWRSPSDIEKRREREREKVKKGGRRGEERQMSGRIRGATSDDLANLWKRVRKRPIRATFDSWSLSKFLG